MRKLRGFIPTTALTLMICFGVTVANAGIILPGRSQQQPVGRACTDNVGKTASTLSKSLSGIILPGLVGIILPGYVGIILPGYADTTNCGIILPG